MAFWFFYSVLLSLICTYMPGTCNFLHLVLLAVSFVAINFYFLSFKLYTGPSKPGSHGGTGTPVLNQNKKCPFQLLYCFLALFPVLVLLCQDSLLSYQIINTIISIRNNLLNTLYDIYQDVGIVVVYFIIRSENKVKENK